MSDDSMIERVAHTIWEENRPEMAPAYEELELMDQLRVRQIAVACIKAMREPTDEMLKACDKIVGSGMGNNHSDRETWEAMIDAALMEGE